MNLKRVLVRICLMGIAASFVGCADGFPDVKPKLVNLTKQRVLPHVLADKEAVKFSAVRDEAGKLQYQALGVIDGGYCFTAKETADVLAWARRNKDRCDQ